MAVIELVTLRDVNTAQYDAVREHAGWIETPPAGGLCHVTWWEGDDCHSLGAWESEEASARFSEQRLAPAMAAAGVATEPQLSFYAAHEIFTPVVAVVAPTAKPSSTAADNVTSVRRGYEAFARGDIATVLSLFDPAIQWCTPETVEFGGTYTGPEGAGEFFSKLPSLYAELHVEPTTFVNQADTVIALGRHHGRSTAGADFDLPFVHVWTFGNGKVTSFTEYFDTVKMNAALGLVLQPA